MRFNLYGMQVYQEEANLFKKYYFYKIIHILTYTITQKRKTKQKKERNTLFTLFTHQGSIKQYYMGITGFRNRQ